MKAIVGIRAIAYLIGELGFEGFIYFLIGLVIMAFINSAIALVPAGVTKICSSDPEAPGGVFMITVIGLFILEFIFF